MTNVEPGLNGGGHTVGDLPGGHRHPALMLDEPPLSRFVAGFLE